MKTIHILTLSNDLPQYQRMKASFIQAGFDEAVCTYTLLDNSADNQHEPYSALNAVLTSCSEPYVLYCHQDVLLDQGAGLRELLKAIENIDARDPRWAILGNASIGPNYRPVSRITDPYITQGTGDTLPKRASCLDENFLVIKTASAIRCSPGLSGFHLYAADLCLQAFERGFAAYVVDFHLTHLGVGVMDERFWRSVDAFKQHWSKNLRCSILLTVTGVPLCLSRYAPVQKILSNPGVSLRIRRPRLKRLITALGLQPGIPWYYSFKPRSIKRPPGISGEGKAGARPF